MLLDPAGVLVGVEVRARTSERAGAPAETVDARRAHRIARSLVAYSASTSVRHVGLRVDLVAARRVPRAGGSALRLTRVGNIGG